MARAHQVDSLNDICSIFCKDGHGMDVIIIILYYIIIIIFFFFGGGGTNIIRNNIVAHI